MGRFFTLAQFVISVAGTLALLALAVGFIGHAGWNIYIATQTGEDNILTMMLRAVGLVVIALAISEVALFLYEEGASERDLHSAGEVRRTLSKFLTIIIIAASLETLVIIFEASRESPASILYPAILLAAVALLVIALATHQWLARQVEESAPEEEAEPEE